jgi:hypothetical protein
MEMAMSEKLSLLQAESIRTAVLKSAADDVISVAVKLPLNDQGRVEVLTARALKGGLRER